MSWLWTHAVYRKVCPDGRDDSWSERQLYLPSSSRLLLSMLRAVAFLFCYPLKIGATLVFFKSDGIYLPSKWTDFGLRIMDMTVQFIFMIVIWNLSGTLAFFSLSRLMQFSTILDLIWMCFMHWCGEFLLYGSIVLASLVNTDVNSLLMSTFLLGVSAMCPFAFKVPKFTASYFMALMF